MGVATVNQISIVSKVVTLKTLKTQTEYWDMVNHNQLKSNSWPGWSSLKSLIFNVSLDIQNLYKNMW